MPTFSLRGYQQQQIRTLKQQKQLGISASWKTFTCGDKALQWQRWSEWRIEEVRWTKGETRNLWWTSGGPGKRRCREWAVLVLEDSFISWPFLVSDHQCLQSPTAQRRTWRPPAEDHSLLSQTLIRTQLVEKADLPWSNSIGVDSSFRHLRSKEAA